MSCPAGNPGTVKGLATEMMLTTIDVAANARAHLMESFLIRPFRQRQQIGFRQRPIRVRRVHQHVPVEVQLQALHVLHERSY